MRDKLGNVLMTKLEIKTVFPWLQYFPSRTFGRHIHLVPFSFIHYFMLSSFYFFKAISHKSYFQKESEKLDLQHFVVQLFVYEEINNRNSYLTLVMYLSTLLPLIAFSLECFIYLRSASSSAIFCIFLYPIWDLLKSQTPKI